MTDLFHESICESYLVNFWTQMCFHPLHTFLILTKRPKRMKSFLDGYYEDPQMPAPFIWLGVTVCNQTEADAKIPILLQTPAAKRFVSVEPMLGPVDLHPYLPGGCDCEACTYGRGCGHKPDWVIAGGETGPGARPMHPDWVRSLRDQCVEAGVPFFFKSWGEWGPNAINMITGEPTFRRFTSFEHYCGKAPTWMYKGDKLICPDGHVPVNGGREGKNYPMYIVRRVGKRRAGRMLDGREWNEVPL
jgi:protein gp37